VDKFGLVAAMVLQSALRARLTEGRKLIAQLAEGYDKASSALRSYAFALEVAKAHYSNGKANEQTLAELIHTKGTAITREAQEAEPMRMGFIQRVDVV
jgi:hypothetical protein